MCSGKRVTDARIAARADRGDLSAGQLVDSSANLNRQNGLLRIGPGQFLWELRDPRLNRFQKTCLRFLKP